MVAYVTTLQPLFNWPIEGSNAVKWTTDISWGEDTITDGGDGISPDWVSSGNGWRADTGEADDQMLIRTQLQFSSLSLMILVGATYASDSKMTGEVKVDGSSTVYKNRTRR